MLAKKRGIGFCLAMAMVFSLPSVFAGGAAEPEIEDVELPSELEVTLWSGNAPPDGVDRYRALNLVPAAEAVEQKHGISIRTNPVSDPAGWGDFSRRYNLAAEAGEAPDIVVSGHTDVGLWGAAGYIVPIADSVEEVQQMYPQFDDVIDTLWDAVTWRGQIWGVPQDVDGRPMYFNKILLSEMGWSAQEIADLPERIRTGDFTLEDMIATAADGVEQGVVEPGHGFWHRPAPGGDFVQFYRAYGGEIQDADSGQLVLETEALREKYDFFRRIVEKDLTPRDIVGTTWDVWHDTVINHDVLFFHGGAWMWAGWLDDGLATEDELFERLGYGLIPSGIPGESGHTLYHPITYMVSSRDATGRPYQQLMIELIAHMTTTELNTRHAVESAHLAILESQLDDPDYLADQFLGDLGYFAEYAYFAPNHPQYGQFIDALFESMVDAERGELSPDEAVDEVVARLRMEIPDLIIR